MENNNLDKIFKDALGEHSVLPNNNLWNKIETKLPEKKHFFSGWIKYGIAAAIGGFVAISSYLIVQNNEVVKHKIAILKSIKKDSKSVVKESSENIVLPTKNEPTQFDTLVKKQNKYSNIIASSSIKPKDLMEQSNYNNKGIITDDSKPALISNRTENNVLFASKNKVSMELMKLFRPSLIANLEDEYNRTIKGKVGNTIFIDDLLQRQLYFVKGFHVGVKGEFNNTWILVTQPSSITKAQSTQINYKIDAGLAYGFLAGYDFNNKFGIQIEYHLVSQIAQRYEVTSQYTIQDKTTRLKLNYSHIPLLFKFKWHPLKGVEQKPVVMDYIIGIQYGWLKSNDVSALASTTDGSGNNYIKKQVNLTEWDLVGGVNYDIYLNQNFFVSMGGRATYGSNLRNFFNTNSLQKSRNVTIGIEMGLHYKLPFGKKIH